MPVDRNTTAVPNTDQAWSKWQRTVNEELPRRLQSTAQAIRKIQRMRRGR